ncbi:MAG: hypothetical protein JXQ82_07720 [Methanomicrobiaceae archaeon]|nr:hypothetical protein [Methanomicrobiaceae archaeon]
MISAELKAAIFKSIPKQLNTQNVFVEYSDRCNVSHKLKDYPVVVTLRYFGNRTDKSRTPANHIMEVERTEDEIIYTKGEYQQVTLSINVYAADTSGKKAADIIDDYMQLLQVWTLRDLPGVVEIVDKTGVSDLSYLDSGERRNLDIYIRHSVSYDKTEQAINSLESDFSL